MSIAYCIDISGSISQNQIEAAFAFVQKGIEPGDCVIVFDIYAKIVSLDWPQNPCEFYGRGGTDATEALLLAKNRGYYSTVLISDGALCPMQLAQFSKFIDIETLVK